MIQKYSINVENGYLCPDNDQLETPMTLYRVDRLNRTHAALTLDFSIAHPVDKAVEGVIITERASESGWIQLPVFPFQQNPCPKILNGSFKESRALFINFGKAIGLENIEKCDFPAGHYSVNRFPVEIGNDMPFWEGRFRFTAILRRSATKKKLFCAVTVISFKEM